MERTIKDRTIEFIRYKGINMKTFETMCDLSSGYVTSMRKGYGPEKLNNVLTAFPDLNRDWLLYGEGEMLNADAVQETGAGQERQDAPREERRTATFVKLIPVAAQGGSLTDFIYSVKEQDCELIASPIRDVDLAIQVSGDSMAPEYPNGSHVYVKRINERAFIEWGKVYVLDTCNGSVIKILVPSDREGYVRCLSINTDPKYAPFEVSLEDIRGVYRVLLCMSLK